MRLTGVLLDLHVNFIIQGGLKTGLIIASVVFSALTLFG